MKSEPHTGETLKQHATDVERAVWLLYQRKHGEDPEETEISAEYGADAWVSDMYGTDDRVGLESFNWNEIAEEMNELEAVETVEREAQEKTCKTCVHWLFDRAASLRRKGHGGGGAPIGKCKSPKLVYLHTNGAKQAIEDPCGEPVPDIFCEDDGLQYWDGEGWCAGLETGQDFGCIHHWERAEQ
jgi:hypothetical protein